MAQHVGGHAFDMRGAHRRRALEGGQRPRGAQHHQVGAQPVDGRLDAEPGNLLVHAVVDLHARQRLARAADPFGQRGQCPGMPGAEARRIEIEGQPRLDDALPLIDVATVLEFHHQAEAIQQLRTQLALFRIHGADQREARRVRVRDAVALDRVDAARGRVEQHVDQAVGQQVDLVHIEHAQMRARQQPGRETHGVLAERAGQVQRAGHVLVGGAQRQRHEAALRQ